MAPLVRYLLCCSALMGLLIMQHSAVHGRAINGGCAGHGCWSSETEKMISGRILKVEELRPLMDSGRRRSLGGDAVGWEMRYVPSGPDPLHHNGSPKKPQTP